MALTPDTRIGSYEITAQIGVGGMGEVYRARDTKLDRDVAIKVLPEALAHDAERLSRFEREAKTLAALNHPGIAHIYGIEDTNGSKALVMELVEGPTLAERIARGPIPVDEALPIAKQIAEALEAAHEQGIIHRDLKPGNIKVTPDGVVKVLDFGLAKALKPEQSKADLANSPTLLMTAAATRAGLILGTAAYMSPEQARGEPVDKRTDIWAFGAVLFEMLTARRLFDGATVSDTLAAVLRADPEWAHLPSTVPPSVHRLLRQCLRRSRRTRTPDIAVARIEIEEAQAVGGPDLTLQPTARPAFQQQPVLVIALVLLAGIAGYWLGGERSVPSSDPRLRLANPIQVTFERGLELSPAWSPDGQMLAFTSELERDSPGPGIRNLDVWVAQLGGAQPINRTAGHDGLDVAPSWSPDGRELAFLSDRDSDVGVFVMSPLGGTPRKVGAFSSSLDHVTFRAGDWSLQWLTAGTELGTAIPSDEGVDVATILTLATGEMRQIPLPGPRSGRIHLRWSPDDQYLAYVAALAASNETTQLWVLRMSDGEATPVTDGMTQDLSPSWSPDSSALYFVSNRGGGMDLWRQPMEAGVPDGEPDRVTAGVGMRQATLSPDGTKLVYARGQRVANLWRAPILQDRPATWSDAEQLTFHEAYIEFVDVAPDGSRIAVSSNRSGNQDIWTLSANGGEMLQLTNDRSPDWDPHWSPDGRQLAFYSNRSGNRDIWVMPTAGGAARQVTTHEGSDLLVSWSPDGAELVFASDRSGTNAMWVVPLSGGAARELAAGFRTAWSPSGRWIATDRVGEDGVWRVPATGGGVEQLTTQGWAPKWAPDERHVFFLNRVNGRDDVWAVSLEDGGERAMTDLAGRSGEMSASALATDGTYLYFAWGPNAADLWVMDVLQVED